MRLIADGVVDREGVPGLAGRLGYSTRQVERLLLAGVGAGPVALARAQRAQSGPGADRDDGTAHGRRGLCRRLRQHPPVQRLGPGHLRPEPERPAAAGTPPARRASGPDPVPSPRPDGRTAPALPGAAVPRQPLRAPGGHRGARSGGNPSTAPTGARCGCLTGRGGRRSPHRGPHTRRGDTGRPRDLGTAIARCRRLLDLDADPQAVEEALSAEPALAPLVEAAPGRRVPRTVDEAEMAVRAVLGQQVSTAAARTHAGRSGHRLRGPGRRPGGRPLTDLPRCLGPG